MLQLESARQMRVDAEAEQQRAQEEKESAEGSLESARAEREKKQVDLASLKMPDLLDVLSSPQQHELKAELTGLLESLGLPSALNTVQELNQVYRQAFTLVGRSQAAILSLWRSKNRKMLIILLIAAFLVVPLVSWLIEHLLHAPGTAAVTALIGDISLAVGGFAAAVKKRMASISNFLTQLEAKRNQVLGVVESKRQEVSQKELKLQQELEKLQANEDAARKRVLSADAKVRELERKLEDIKSGRSLSKFLLERVQGEDYRRHLGIMSLVRRDFEKLNYLLTKGEEGLDQVGRIILYVDDLDRCPADKVVEVLQAVHLLLGMPIFVAVVGVDLRWLLHSLDQQYTAFHQGGESNREEKSVRPEWITNPQSYLEKIFQIPFTLKAMDEQGFGKLISSLMPVSNASAREAEVLQDTESENVGGDSGGDATSTAAGLGPPMGAGDREYGRGRAQEGALTASGATDDARHELDPEALLIRPWERDFAAQLFPLIPSPRATKRFTNIYRLLKAPLTGADLEKFEGKADALGDFQAAMLLLSITIGLPQQAQELFPAIASAKASKSWRELLAEHLSLTQKQAVVLKEVGLSDSLAPFVTWCSRVARFTFEAAKSGKARRSPSPRSKAVGAKSAKP